MTNGEIQPLFLESHFLRLELATTATAILEACITLGEKILQALRAANTFTRDPSETALEALDRAKAHVDYWEGKLWIFKRERYVER